MDAIDPRTVTVRRTLEAACLAVGGVLVVAGFGLFAATATPAEEVAWIAGDEARFLTGSVVLALAGLAIAAGSIGVAQLARARGSGLLTTGAATTAIGGAALALAVWGYAVAGRLLVDEAVPRSVAVSAFDRANGDVVLGLGWVLGMGALVGPLLIGAALLRSRVGPRWLAGLLVVAPVVAFFATGGWLGALLALPYAAALIGLAVLVHRSGQAEAAALAGAPAGAAAVTAAAPYPTSPAPREPHASERGRGRRRSAT